MEGKGRQRGRFFSGGSPVDIAGLLSRKEMLVCSARGKVGGTRNNSERYYI